MMTSRRTSELFAASTTRGDAARELGSGAAEAAHAHLWISSGCCAQTEFPSVMQDMLALLSKAYDYPVDIEFTVNFTRGQTFSA